MNNTTPKITHFEGRSLEDLKSSYRALVRKSDTLASEAAFRQGLPKEGQPFFISGQIDWDNPNVSDIKPAYFEAIEKAGELHHIIGRLEASQINDLPRWEARQKANHFLHSNFVSIDEVKKWLNEHGCITSLDLAEKILENPNYLEEVET